MNIFHKQPNESFTISIDFSNNLVNGDTINTYTVIGYLNDVDVTSTIINSDSNDDDKVYIEVKNGNDGNDYKITVVVNSNESNIFEDDVLMRVLETTSYTTYQEVDRLLKWFSFSTTSKVTIDDINNYFIPEADQIINGYVGRIYELPITNLDDLLILKYISTRIVACEVAHVLVLQASGDISPIVKRWCDEAKQKLQDILNRELVLFNSTLKVNDRLYSFTSHGNNDYEAPDPIWELNTEQW